MVCGGRQQGGMRPAEQRLLALAIRRREQAILDHLDGDEGRSLDVEGWVFTACKWRRDSQASGGLPGTEREKRGANCHGTHRVIYPVGMSQGPRNGVGSGVQAAPPASASARECSHVQMRSTAVGVGGTVSLESFRDALERLGMPAVLASC